MSKDALDRTADAVKRTVDDVRDAAHEGGHRSAADAEHARRDLLGDEMRPSEKAGSIADEAKNRAQAEVDKIKRELRDKT